MFKMRTRGALKDLQVSATDKTILVGSPVFKRATLPKQAPVSNKFFQKEKAKMPKVIEKENSKRRKNAKTEKISKISKSEMKKSSLKLEKNVTSSLSKANEISTLHPAEMDTYQSTSHASSNVEVSSKFDLTNVTVDQNVSDIIPLVTSDSFSHSYWQDLAEQRRTALEKTLLENEQLFDQVTVLQTENSLLKDALDSAEKLLKREGFLE